MNNYTPPYTITSKILKLSTTIVADKTIKRDISKLKEQNRLIRVEQSLKVLNNYLKLLLVKTK